MNQKLSFPVDQLFPELKKALDQSKPVMLKAAPGAGKTTRVPLWLLEQEWIGDKKIIMLEPRRLAARNSAEFMANERREKVGETVGYRVRLDHCVSEQTQVEVVTEAMLTGMLINDPELSDVACIIFDEFHERNLSSDIAMAMVLEMRQYVRDDLRVIIMSATMDEAPLLKRIDELQVLACDGRQFPLEIDYQGGEEQSPDLEQIKKIVKHSIECDTGDILVFLPGKHEILNLIKLLEKIPDLDLYPLYSQLPYAEQKRATAKKSGERRSVIVSTDIAETSLTIPGIRVVIDSGFKREVVYDSQTGSQGLKLSRISKDSADQRAGRAGREAVGKAYRTWNVARHKLLDSVRRPEIEHSNLEKTVLEVLAWGSTWEEFPWITAPSQGIWNQTCSRLKQIKAINEKGLTNLGQSLLNFPMEPRLARIMLVGKELGCGNLAALICTWFNSRDVSQKGEVDWEFRLQNYYKQIKRNNPQDQKEYQDACRRVSASSGEPNWEDLMTLMLKACPEQLAMQRKDQAQRYLLAQGGGIHLHQDAKSFNRYTFLFCPIVFKNHKGEAQVRVVLPIEQVMVDEMILNESIHESTLSYDQDKAKVLQFESIKWMDLILKQVPITKGDLEEKAEYFWSYLKTLNFKELPISKEGKGWLERYQIYRTKEEGLDKLDDDNLMKQSDTWLKPYVAGLHSWKELEQVDWLYAIQGLATSDVVQVIDKLLPSHIQVPSGSRIAIDYSDVERPVLSVRIQEIFGLTQTPRLLNGKVQLTIELLSPARRPIQVTSDLASFWEEGYFEVRKELKRRYPKHAWPDKPLEAQALRGIKRPSS